MKIRQLRQKFPKSELNKFRKSFYDIKNIRNLSESEIGEAEKSLIEFEKNLHNFKEHHDYDDDEYGRDIRKLFNQFDKDYYKPIKTVSSFDNKSNYIEYKSEGDKDNKLSPKEDLNMIRP